MIIYLFRLLGTFLFGYLFIKWFPDMDVQETSDIVVELVMHPIEFFASSIVFIFGLLIQGKLLRTEFYYVMRLFKGDVHKELLIVPVHVCMMYGLFMMGSWETLFFSFLAVFYGIISLDFRRQGGHHA
ncbi:hypothetical protein LCM10_06705 [Rossellomorea aquimaris]|uniref:hypothetical protein n=1 Tax=Rossellomorea aquimaris TaxID=189382 RepID=UPI001CD255D6|nr:hypothetical protein [Rossellomorea aquimaris]MCA1054672.1 hypothetical protein [Rossellomorea aquimaris]